MLRSHTVPDLLSFGSFAFGSFVSKMTQKKRPWRHQRWQMGDALEPLHRYQDRIRESIDRTENTRSFVVDSMKILSENLGARGERMYEGVKALAREMQRGGDNREAMPKTMPACFAQYYVNQHVECSNDGTNWHDATLTRIGPDAHELHVRVWYHQVPGLRFIRPLQGPRKRPREDDY